MNQYIFTTSLGDEIPVIITSKRGLRNITLRPKIVQPHEIRISKPVLTSTSVALKFLEKKRDWVDNIFAGAPEKKEIKSGDILEFMGVRVLLQHDSSSRGNFYMSDFDFENFQIKKTEKTENVQDNFEKILIIGGGEDMFDRRVRDFVKAEFLSTIKEIIAQAPDEFKVNRITIRDTSSRWGSCSSTRNLSFSWRLAFAPLDVLRYVVMHELAHLRHMDHSAEFWNLVSELYGFGVQRAKRWLAKNGQELHTYF